MKIILHMGQSKTGTSSLQKSLNAACSTLRGKGVFYPQFGNGIVAHHLLAELCTDQNILPRWTLEKVGGAEGAVKKAARRAWDLTCEDIRRNRPEVLVLSSEFLAHQTDRAAKARLGALLTTISSDITPVIYVRHPVDHYRARLQQWIKHRDHPFPPISLNLQEATLDTEAAFARPPELVVFDRKKLLGGDVVHDFAERFLSSWIQPSDLPSLNANVGLSAEALVLMVQLRSEAGGSYEAARRGDRLIPHLTALDQSDPPALPLTLLPEVAEAALRSATGHRWLVEAGRLHIPNLDISRIDGAPLPDWMTTAPPETFFLHDAERLDRLRQAIEKHYSARNVRGQPDRPLAEPKPRIRDLVLRFLQRKLALLEDRNTGAAPTGENPARRSSQGDRNADT